MRLSDFERFQKILLHWNEIHNLTAITDSQEIAIKHFEDSLVPLPFLPESGRLLDIGTGAGFPGIPLKIERSDLEVVLLDSRHKKIDFCNIVIQELGLENIEALHGRAEDRSVQKKLGFFDIVISRATFPLDKFLKVSLPFSKENGILIAMRGREWEKELKEIKIPANLKLVQKRPYSLSQKMGKRAFLIFKKI